MTTNQRALNSIGFLTNDSSVMLGRELIGFGFASSLRPIRVHVSGGETLWREDVPADWIERSAELSALFETGSMLFVGKNAVGIEQPERGVESPEKFLRLIEKLRFQCGACEMFRDEWEELPDFEPRGGLGAPLGWAAFFQGGGHRQLVSRRWLEHGPWRVLSGSNDTTLIQFHDLHATPDEAWRQARSGHEWLMGRPSKARGHIPRSSLAKELANEALAAARAMYVHADRTLRIVVQGREVPYDEMLHACHARVYGLEQDQPIDAVRYIFLEEKAARAHLADLWLRELECWTFDSDGEEIRIDKDFYLEPPPKPEWVQKLERNG